MESPTKIIIDVETIHTILNYLATQPWKDVNELIVKLQIALQESTNKK